uniref:Nucleoside diphosphate kinase, mitochondrial n=1 Tax=Macaca mulatta TaxID=9544 RepID=A0A5F8A1X3_MACMU
MQFERDSLLFSVFSSILTEIGVEHFHAPRERQATGVWGGGGLRIASARGLRGGRGRVCGWHRPPRPLLALAAARGPGVMGGLFWRSALRGLRCGPRAPDPSLLVRPSSGGPSWTRERTLVAVKPDGVQRRLVGDVIQRFERRGFTLVGMKMLQAPESVLAEHYQDLRRKPFYPALIRYMSSGPMVAMVWEGYNVVRASRAMIGHTDSAEAAPGTIRGDFSVHISRYGGPDTPGCCWGRRGPALGVVADPRDLGVLLCWAEARWNMTAHVGDSGVLPDPPAHRAMRRSLCVICTVPSLPDTPRGWHGATWREMRLPKAGVWGGPRGCKRLRPGWNPVSQLHCYSFPVCSHRLAPLDRGQQGSNRWSLGLLRVHMKPEPHLAPVTGTGTSSTPATLWRGLSGRSSCGSRAVSW